MFSKLVQKQNFMRMSMKMNQARMFSASVWSDSVKARVTLPAPAFSGMAWTEGTF
jgi:hypothetical protein